MAVKIDTGVHMKLLASFVLLLASVYCLYSGDSMRLFFVSFGLCLLCTYNALFGKTTVQFDATYTELDADYMCKYSMNGKYWVTNPWEEVDIPLAKKGLNSEEPRTIFTMFDQALANHEDKEFYRQEVIDKQTGEYKWRIMTLGAFYNEVQRASRAFISLGLSQWESVNIIGFNSPEWIIADVGAIYAGGLAAGVYTTNNAGQCEYVANHSKAAIVVVENEKQLNKYLEVGDNIDTLKAIIMWNGNDIPDNAKKNYDFDVMKWDEFIQLGDDMSIEKEAKKRRRKISPGNCCTLIYTSGTTGPPKAVMLSHDNIVMQTRSMWSSLGDFNLDIGQQRLVSYLPLSHVAAQLADLWLPLSVDCYYNGYCTVTFARVDAMKGTLVKTLRNCKPTVFFGVPRVWEKIQEKMLSTSKNASALKKSVSSYAKSIGLQAFRELQVGSSHNINNIFPIADKIIFNTVKKVLGLDKCDMFITGAAPIKQSTLDYFGSLGIQIKQVYGMSESCGLHTCEYNYYFKANTVGPTSPIFETRIEHLDDRDDPNKPNEGEICMRGRNIMMGYMYDVDKTMKTIDPNGWLHSGDFGKIDADNFVCITGRLKDLIITSGGENVAPIPIENYLKDNLKCISNAVLIGDDKKYLTVLITLKLIPDKSDDSTGFTNLLHDDCIDAIPNCNIKTIDEAINNDEINNHIQNIINQYNNDPTVCVSNAQRIQYFKILNTDFSVDNGLLTSTLKLKRAVIVNEYQHIINDMY